jgi:hypothetical protein
VPCKLTAPQCGCPAGEACSFAPAAHVRSCQASGTDLPGHACNVGQCAPGSICLGSGQGLCFPFCDTDADCASQGGICALQISDGMGGSIPNETLCTNSCDLITNTGCSVADTSCQLGREQSGQMRWFTFCQSDGTKGQSMSCTSSADCVADFGCVGTPGTCRQYCNANDFQACGGLGCSILMDQNMMPVAVNGVELGVCP